tara:strand:- start:12402 stop:13172 length:771 start_codon:yes stop_codon:yes gene_type:complete
MAITTKVSQIIIRKDNASAVPTLGAGEFMLAEDEQRLFLGQAPVTGVVESSTTTNASVSFAVPIGGISTPLYLSNLADYSIVVTKAADSSTTTIASNNVTVSDADGEGSNPPIYTFAHGLGGAVAGADTFVLHYNKEITSTPTDDRVKRNTIKFTNTGGQVETTGINFSSAVVNDISIDYALFNATHMRKGTLSILVNGNSASNIEDKFIGDSQLVDIEFSVTNNGSGTFTLKFKTALTTELQFNYTQTASKFVTT